MSWSCSARTRAVLASLLLSLGLGCSDTDLGGNGVLQLGVGANPIPDCQEPPVQDLHVKINEVMLINDSTIVDDLGHYSAWIELYNPTDETVDLGGVLLSDDIGDIDKWKIPCGIGAVIDPQDFLIIWLDGDEANDRDLHASFVPDPTADVKIYLNGGSDIVTVFLADIASDASVGRYPDGGAFFGALFGPSPGAPNLESVEPLQAEFLRGDANGDGVVDLLDLDELLVQVFEVDDLPSCQDVLDVNDNGLINVVDANFLARALSGALSIPAPTGVPGVDTTEDDLECPFIIGIPFSGESSSSSEGGQ